MSLLGVMAFTSLVQGWTITRNKWYETILLGLSALILLNPRMLTDIFRMNQESRHWMYIPGIILVVCVYLLQRKIRNKAPGDLKSQAGLSEPDPLEG